MTPCPPDHPRFPRKTPAQQTTLPTPLLKWLSEHWGHRGVSPVQPVGDAGEKHPYIFLEGPSDPHLSAFPPRSGENPLPQESVGFLHELFVIVFSLFALLEQKHLKRATSAFERSQMRKRCSDLWNVIW